MSKNNQRNLSEINLGNETYSRGLAEGLAGVPKTIKKTHRHAHRYHIGYRHGEDQRKREAACKATVQMAVDAKNVNISGLPEDTNPLVRVLTRQHEKEASFWHRLKGWLKS